LTPPGWAALQEKRKLEARAAQIDREFSQAIQKLTEKHQEEQKRIQIPLERAKNRLQETCFHASENTQEEVQLLPTHQKWWCPICGKKLTAEEALKSKKEWAALVARHHERGQPAGGTCPDGHARGGGGSRGEASSGGTVPTRGVSSTADVSSPPSDTGSRCPQE
jgi:hypothetical protein